MSWIIQMIKSIFIKKCDFCNAAETKEDYFLYDDTGVLGHRSCWIADEIAAEREKFGKELEMKDIHSHIYEVEATRLHQENHEMLQFICVLVKLSGGRVSIPTSELIEADGRNFEASHDVRNKAIVLSLRE